MCASACVLVLAGGVERLVGPAPRIGVHQITTVMKETDGVARLTSTRKVYEQVDVDAAVSALPRRVGRGRSGDGAHAQDAGGQHSLAQPRRS